LGPAPPGQSPLDLGTGILLPLWEKVASEGGRMRGRRRRPTGAAQSPLTKHGDGSATPHPSAEPVLGSAIGRARGPPPSPARGEGSRPSSALLSGSAPAYSAPGFAAAVFAASCSWRRAPARMAGRA